VSHVYSKWCGPCAEESSTRLRGRGAVQPSSEGAERSAHGQWSRRCDDWREGQCSHGTQSGEGHAVRTTERYRLLRGESETHRGTHHLQANSWVCPSR